VAVRDSGVSGPSAASGCAKLAILFFVLALLVVLGGPWLLPDGVGIDGLEFSESSKGPKAYEGLLFVPAEGVGNMTFTRVELLRENDALRDQGRQKSETICASATADLLRRIEAELRTVPAESNGKRPLWVRFTAERRFGAWPCLQRPEDARRGVTQLGLMLRIVSVQAIRPLGCDGLLFVINHLRCPEAPKPVALTDKEGSLYPEAALRAGKGGSVVVRLLADSSGSMLSCETVESSGDPSLDSGACELLRKRPDLISKEGRTDGFATGVREVTQRVTWRLPDRDS
jgi:TonB family protein